MVLLPSSSVFFDGADAAALMVNLHVRALPDDHGGGFTVPSFDWCYQMSAVRARP